MKAGVHRSGGLIAERTIVGGKFGFIGRRRSERDDLISLCLVHTQSDGFEHDDGPTRH